MIGNCKPKIVIEHKKTLMESSMKFAEQEHPDFIIMKEAIIAFEKILITQSQQSKEEAVISDEQKMYLFKMISVINSKFGT